MSSELKKILLALGLLSWFAACQKLPLPQNSRAEEQATAGRATRDRYQQPKVLALIKEKYVTESSGIVAASSPGIYWTHNDSGDGPFLYAIDSSGEGRGVWRVTGATARDWEDIAAGPGPDRKKRYLYIGDIGNNNDRREELVVYRLPEPNIIDEKGSSRKKPLLTYPAETIRIRYPDGPSDSETLLVHPRTGDLYVVTKAAFSSPVVYKAKAPLSAGNTVTLTRVADLDMPGLLGGVITGGEFSPDGRSVALCDYLQGFELILPVASKNFDDIWKQPITTVDLGKREQGEALTYRLDGKALIATSEGKSSPLIEVLRR